MWHIFFFIETKFLLPQLAILAGEKRLALPVKLTITHLKITIEYYYIIISSQYLASWYLVVSSCQWKTTTIYVYIYIYIYIYNLKISICVIMILKLFDDDINAVVECITIAVICSIQKFLTYTLRCLVAN